MNWTAIIVFVLLFGAVTIIGFAAAHWRRGDLDVLDEWGLAGRRLGTVVIWFLLGGDIYTAYTFIAVPALVFGAGAIGFFALPYTIIVYPLVFLILPRMLLSSAGRGVVVATIAALVFTVSEPPLAIAGPATPASKGVSATTASSDATDFSAVRRRRYYRGGSAAGLAFMGMAIGTIGAIAAQQQRNDYYNNYGYGYGYGPGYYGGGPYYYGGGPYYGRRYYRPY